MAKQFQKPRTWCLLVILLHIALSVAMNASGGELPVGSRHAQILRDVRLNSAKTLKSFLPFNPAANASEWRCRSNQLRNDLAVALGLWPMPKKTPINAVVHGKIEASDYTVEKVYFESLPGFFVTGSLYRPRKTNATMPGVLCPHGHWPGGRFMDCGELEIANKVARGEERFSEGGRSQVQSRCVQLTRMGCVVFAYDMIGYGDCTQLSVEVAHSLSQRRPQMESAENWGFQSPQAEAHLQSVMGLQAWNSIRALDFLAALPGVDASRIGITGESGGATQAMILCALDDRLAAAFLAVMISPEMQGGCICENASLLRVKEGNVAFAAMFAPKPMGLTAADDWTRNFPGQGYPELLRHYTMLQAADNVMLSPLLQFKHNYNCVSRSAMYRWMNRHLQLDQMEPIQEQEYRRLSVQEQSVWDDQHPRPISDVNYEQRLLAGITLRDQELLAAFQESTSDFRSVYGGAFHSLIGRDIYSAGNVKFRPHSLRKEHNHEQIIGLLSNQTYGEQLPVLCLEPDSSQNRVVIWINTEGRAGLFDDSNGAKRVLKPALRSLLENGVAIVAADLFNQGEFRDQGDLPVDNRRVANDRDVPAFTYCYNPPMFAQRVHDILSLIRFTRNRYPQSTRIDLVGLNGAGNWVAAAGALAHGAISGLALDTDGFRFHGLTNAFAADFLPGGAKYGDLPGLLALAAPLDLWLAGEGDTLPPIVTKIYRLSKADSALQVASKLSSYDSQVVSWLFLRGDYDFPHLPSEGFSANPTH